MPLNCIPVTTTRAALDAKRARREGQLRVDVGFWGGVVPGNAGASSTGLARGRRARRARLPGPLGHRRVPARRARRELRAAMPVLRDAGLPLLVHAELGSRARRRATPIRAATRGYLALAAARRGGRGDRAADRAVPRDAAAPVHIVHLAVGERARRDPRAPRRGPAAHRRDLPALPLPRGRGDPRRRHRTSSARRRSASARTARRCGAALADGVIDVVVTDHSPCTPALKRAERGDFVAAWGGIASLQLGLAAVWTEARAARRAPRAAGRAG